MHLTFNTSGSAYARSACPRWGQEGSYRLPHARDFVRLRPGSKDSHVLMDRGKRMRWLLRITFKLTHARSESSNGVNISAYSLERRLYDGVRTQSDGRVGE